MAVAIGFGAALVCDRLHLIPLQGSEKADAPGSVDIGYAQFMTVHHDQAVVLCQIVLARGSSRLGELANAILVNQLLEMGQMRGWLLLWDQPLMPTSKHMDWLLKGKTAPDARLLHYIADCNASSAGMVGLASSQELNRLSTLEGDERDRLFLELMIRHHQSALPMAQFAARNADIALIRAQAALVVAEQARELDSMQLQLQQEFGAGK